MVLCLKLVAMLLLCAAPGSGSETGVTRKQVDLIELNHFLDEEGREVFRQVIFYDWSKPNQRFHVRAWRLIKKESQLPVRQWNPNYYQCTWHDGPLLRQVRASKLRETWTQKDPERVNRALLPEDQRVPLFPPRGARTPQTANSSQTRSNR